MKGVKSRGGRKCTPGAGFQKRHDRGVYGLGLGHKKLVCYAPAVTGRPSGEIWFVYLIVASDIHLNVPVCGRQTRRLFSTKLIRQMRRNISYLSFHLR
jgi:hypothetical protein